MIKGKSGKKETIVIVTENYRDRDTCPGQNGSVLFLAKLPRFENSRNVKMTALPSSVPLCSFLHQKSDLSFVRLRRSHELPNRFKNHLDLLIMGADPVFQLCQFLCEFPMR